MTRNEKPISNWELEQYLLAELPDSRMKEIDQLAAEDETLKSRIAELKTSNEEILEQYTPAMVSRSINRKLAAKGETREATRSWSLGLMPVAAASAAMVLVVFAVLYMINTKPFGDPNETILIKGLEAHVRIYRQTGAGVERMSPGDDVKAGDRLQIKYVAAEAAYGLIFSVDGNGSVTRHFPTKGENSVQLETGGEISLPHGYELDNAPNFERFFIVTSAEKFKVSAILDNARQLAKNISEAETAKLPLADDFAQSSFLLRK